MAEVPQKRKLPKAGREEKHYKVHLGGNERGEIRKIGSK